MSKGGRRVFGVGGLALGFGALLAVLPQASPAAPGTASPASPQKTAGTVASRDATFQSALRKLNAFAKPLGGRVSAAGVDLETGTALGDWQPKLELNPASNMKLLTAAAALELLGSSYEFETGLYGLPKPITDSPEGGPALELDELVLRSNGDPTLEVHDLWRLANALSNLGVKRVAKLLVDQSHFDEHFVPPAFEQQPNEWAAFRAPVSAVALSRNTVTLSVSPSQGGNPARLWIEPPGSVILEGKVRTLATGAADVRFSVSPAVAPGKLAVATASGQVIAGQGRVRFTRRLDDPRLTAGHCLKELMLGLGIQVGEVRSGGGSEKRRLTYLTSPPLGSIVRALGKESDNFTAEMLLKKLATTRTKATGEKQLGSSAGGAEVVLDWVTQLGAGGNPQIRNGSGLFDANRLSAAQLIAVLTHAYKTPQLRGDFLAQLSEGGIDGTLRTRFLDAPLRGHVRAKTGTLQRAVSLCGYVFRDGVEAPIAFAILVSDIDGKHAEIRAKIDEAVAALARP